MDPPSPDNTPDPICPVYYDAASLYNLVNRPALWMEAMRWRNMLERRWGLYNVDPDHVCSDECFPPLWRSDRSVPIDSENQPIVMTIHDGYRMYGCQRSGFIHLCPHDRNIRRAICRWFYEDCENRRYCRFSGVEIEGLALIYHDPFSKDDSGRKEHMLTVDSRFKKAPRSREPVPMPQPAADAPPPGPVVTTVSPREREEHRRIQALSKNLQACGDRRRYTADAPSVKPDTIGPIDATTMPLAQVRHIAQIQSKLTMPTKPATLVQIRNHLQAILGDRSAMLFVRNQFNQTRPTNPSPLTSDTLERYATRCGRIYTIVCACGKHSASLADITIGALYLFAHGYRLHNQSILNRDDTIGNRLPDQQHLIWYGIDSEMRLRIPNPRRFDSNDPLVRYSPTCHRKGTDAIKKAFLKVVSISASRVQALVNLLAI